MVKRLFVFLIILLMFLPLINASALGISPSIFKLYFEPNLERTFKFNVFSSNPNETLMISVQGDLAEYVTLSKTSFIQQGTFKAHLKLPASLSTPGNHRILIIAEPYVNTSALEGIAGIAVVRAPIDVFVPYPGKYIEGRLDISHVSQGDTTKYRLFIHNLGTDDLIVNSKIEIYDPEGKKIMTKIIDSGELLSKEEKTLKGLIESSEFVPGIYTAKAIVDFGEIKEFKTEFRIGNLFINITDYSHEFEMEKINKFDVQVESLWNLKLEKVYAHVTITDNGKIVDEFKTSSMDLEPWKKHTFEGFFDTNGLEPKRYIANIRVFYEDKISNKLVAVYVRKPGMPILWIVLIVAGIIFVLTLLIVIIYLVMMVRGIKKSGKKRNKKK